MQYSFCAITPFFYRDPQNTWKEDQKKPLIFPPLYIITKDAKCIE